LCIGVAYIGVFVGSGGLGIWVQAGLTSVSYDIMLAGAIPGALTVLAFDQIFKYIEKAVTPEVISDDLEADTNVAA
jgi:ABC-type proline/glycine betaine transport system permease subunit